MALVKLTVFCIITTQKTRIYELESYCAGLICSQTDCKCWMVAS